MQNSRRVNENIGYWLIGISLVMWVLLLFNPAMSHHSAHHSHSQMASSITTLVQLWSGMMWSWLLMVLAMMLPKLIAPIQYIYRCSFKKRQFRSAILFIAGYTIIWTIIGGLMNIALIVLNQVMPGSLIPVAVAGIIVLAWQFSPVKQKFLNRSHGHRALSVFGRAADRDVLVFGFQHGLWCVGSGWIIMFFPMLLPHGFWHYLAMAMVAFVMISEHMERPQVPEWRIRTGMKLLKIISAQTKIRLSSVIALRTTEAIRNK